MNWFTLIAGLCFLGSGLGSYWNYRRTKKVWPSLIGAILLSLGGMNYLVSTNLFFRCFLRS
jgi:hypothetical protein